MKTSSASGTTSSTSAKHWIGVEAEDIPPGWMDDMVRRLFDVVNRDLIRLEGWQAQESDKKDPLGHPPDVDVGVLERRMRLGKQMQMTLERLRGMENAGLTKRTPKPVKRDEEALQELERRIAELVAARENPKRS